MFDRIERQFIREILADPNASEPRLCLMPTGSRNGATFERRHCVLGFNFNNVNRKIFSVSRTCGASSGNDNSAIFVWITPPHAANICRNSKESTGGNLTTALSNRCKFWTHRRSLGTQVRFWMCNLSTGLNSRRD